MYNYIYKIYYIYIERKNIFLNEQKSRDAVAKRADIYTRGLRGVYRYK